MSKQDGNFSVGLQGIVVFQRSVDRIADSPSELTGPTWYLT
jgi:hypothetical protein